MPDPATQPARGPERNGRPPISVGIRHDSQFRRPLLRAIPSAVGVLAGYFVVPLDGVSDLGSGILLAITLVAFVVICYWQLRRIIASQYPAIQAVETFAVALPLYLVGFAMAYYVMATHTPSTFSEPLSRMASLYFTVTVFATVGFGDITPVSDTARAIVTFQMVANLMLFALGGRIVYSAVQRGRRRRDG